MGDIVTPFKRVSDVDVVMKISNHQTKVGLGNLLILNIVAASPQDGNTPLPDKLTPEEMLNGIILRKTDATSGAIYREYRNLEAVKHDYTGNSDVLTKVEAYFSQENHSDKIAILDLPTGKEVAALGAFWYFDWTFACLAKNDDNQSTLIALSNIFEVNQDHLFVVETHDLTLSIALQGQNYTFVLYHDLSEAMDSPIVGTIANKPVGSTTWKFKTLNNVTPESLTADELNSITRANAIAYTTVFGKDQTTEGKTASGEYIDTIHGIIWVKNEMQRQIEKLLQDNDKIPYDQVGINMILSVARQVLNKAYEMGIIQSDDNGKADFTITATPRSQQSAEDLSNRHYGGISFTYHAAGAIHSLTVQGSIDSDTILG
jgi:hypothetical protein